MPVEKAAKIIHSILRKVDLLLDQQGKNVTELCAVLNMDRSNYYKLPNSKTINPVHLVKMSEFFNVPISFFFNEFESVESLEKKPAGVEESTFEYIKKNNGDQEKEALKKEVEYLKHIIRNKDEILKDKNEIIELLKRK